MSNNDSLLPLSFDSFKKDMQILFSFTTQDLAAVLDELEKKGTKFSDFDIARLLKSNREDTASIRDLLLYVIPKVNENQQRITQELYSIQLDKQKIDFLINRISKFREETIRACEILFLTVQYLADKPHISKIKGELTLTPIYHNDGQLMILPLINIKINTHQKEEDGWLPQEILITIDARQLEMVIANLETLLSEMQSQTRQLKDILGNKIITGD